MQAADPPTFLLLSKEGSDLSPRLRRVRSLSSLAEPRPNSSTLTVVPLPGIDDETFARVLTAMKQGEIRSLQIVGSMSVPKWTALQGCDWIRALHLRDPGSLDSQLGTLASLRGLRELELVGGSVDLGKWPKMAPKLELMRLSLSGTKFQGEGLQTLMEPMHLTELEIGLETELGGTLPQLLSSASSLELLVVDAVIESEGSSDYNSWLSELRILRGRAQSLRALGMTELSQFSKLVELSVVMSGEEGSELLRSLPSTMSRLTVIDMLEIRGADWACINDTANLTTLSLVRCGFEDRADPWILNGGRLTALRLDLCDLTGTDMKIASPLKSMWIQNPEGGRVTEIVGSVAKPELVLDLGLNGSPLTCDLGSILSQFGNLRTFSASKCGLTNVTLGAMMLPDKVTDLDLSHNAVGGVALSSLVSGNRLEKLKLNWCGEVDDDFVAVLRGMPLRHLDLSSSSITDKSVSILVELEGLSTLDIQGTMISLKGAQAIQTALPTCFVLGA